MSCVCSHLVARCNHTGGKEGKKKEPASMASIHAYTWWSRVAQMSSERKKPEDEDWTSDANLCLVFFFYLLANDYRKSRAHELLFSVHWWCRDFVHPSIHRRKETLLLSCLMETERQRWRQDDVNRVARVMPTRRGRESDTGWQSTREERRLTLITLSDVHKTDEDIKHELARYFHCWNQVSAAADRQ